MPINRNSARDLLLLTDFESDSPSLLTVAYIHGGANREGAAKCHDVGISICQPFHVVVTGLVCTLVYLLYRPYLQVVRLVQRMADQLPSNKLQVVFLINNYHEVRKIR